MLRKYHYPAIFLVLVMCACGVQINGVEVPATTNPNNSFDVVIEVEITNTDAAYGGAAILIPNDWDASNVHYEGSFHSGDMYPCQSYSDYLEDIFTSEVYEKWCGFATQDTLPFIGEEIYYINMTVNTDDLLGTIELGFHAAYTYDVEYWYGTYAPDPVYGYFIEVLPTSLNRETWATIKASFD